MANWLYRQCDAEDNGRLPGDAVICQSVLRPIMSTGVANVRVRWPLGGNHSDDSIGGICASEWLGGRKNDESSRRTNVEEVRGTRKRRGKSMSQCRQDDPLILGFSTRWDISMGWWNRPA